MITKKVSYSLTNTKYLLTCFIVCLHCRIKSDDIDSCPELFRYIDIGIGMFCDCAVPGFFLISAYLFCAKFEGSQYFDKIQSRFKSLLIPYLIFSIAGLCHHCVTQVLKHQMDITSLHDVVSAIFTQKYNGPIWYLVTLFHFFLCAPVLIYYIKKYKGIGAMVLISLFFLINYAVSVEYTSLFFWMPVIIAGSYVGIRTSHNQPISIPWYIGLLFVPLFVYTYLNWGNDFHSFTYFTYRMLGGVFIVILFQKLQWRPFGFEKYMMFIFLTQIMLKSLAIIPNRMELSLVKVVEVIVIGTLIGMIISHAFPRLYNVLTGSR